MIPFEVSSVIWQLSILRVSRVFSIAARNEIDVIGLYDRSRYTRGLFEKAFGESAVILFLGKRKVTRLVTSSKSVSLMYVNLFFDRSTSAVSLGMLVGTVTNPLLLLTYFRPARTCDQKKMTHTKVKDVLKVKDILKVKDVTKVKDSFKCRAVSSSPCNR